MDRLRLLGMEGILPGFQGNVPMQMPELFPKANTSAGWVDALDPLFDKIAKGIATKMQADFGPASFVEADGWFALETGPWYSGTDKGKEELQAPTLEALAALGESNGGSPSIGHLPSAQQQRDAAEAAARAAQQKQIDANFLSLMTYAKQLEDQERQQQQQPGSAGLASGSTGQLRQAPVAPCTVSKPFFIVPTEEEAYSRAKVVFASLVHASPNSTWVYQGYPWFRVYAACPQSRPALRAFVRGFTRAIPEGKLLILDLVADSAGRAIWAYPPDPVTKQPFAQNASLIWCALSNWGGAVHIGGDLTYVLNQTRQFFETPTASGVGLTPEGIDNSPAYFSLVLDSPWRTPADIPTAADWYSEWGHGRCGAVSATAAKAYDLLFQSVYRPGKPYLWCCSNPVYCPTATPGDKQPAQPDYNTTILRQALELMVQAAPECDTLTFRYDLVDVAREWLRYIRISAVDSLSHLCC